MDRPNFTRERAKIAADSRWAKLAKPDRTEATRAARAAFERKFEDAPNPEAARRAYYRRLAWNRWHRKGGHE